MKSFHLHLHQNKLPASGELSAQSCRQEDVPLGVSSRFLCVRSGRAATGPACKQKAGEQH